jgi:hypothetical protein
LDVLGPDHHRHRQREGKPELAPEHGDAVAGMGIMRAVSSVVDSALVALVITVGFVAVVMVAMVIHGLLLVEKPCPQLQV